MATPAIAKASVGDGGNPVSVVTLDQGAGLADQQLLTLADGSTVGHLVKVTNAAPGNTDDGAVVREVTRGDLTVTGTLTNVNDTTPSFALAGRRGVGVLITSGNAANPTVWIAEVSQDGATDWRQWPILDLTSGSGGTWSKQVSPVGGSQSYAIRAMTTGFVRIRMTSVTGGPYTCTLRATESIVEFQSVAVSANSWLPGTLLQMPDSGGTLRTPEASNSPTIGGSGVEFGAIVRPYMLTDGVSAQALKAASTAAVAADPAAVITHRPASKINFRNLNATVQAIKASAGSLFGLTIVNSQGATAFVQVFDGAAGSVVLGTTTPDYEYQVAANTTQVGTFPIGVAFGTAISVASTTLEGGSVGSANGVMAYAHFQ